MLVGENSSRNLSSIDFAVVEQNNLFEHLKDEIKLKLERDATEDNIIMTNIFPVNDNNPQNLFVRSSTAIIIIKNYVNQKFLIFVLLFFNLLQWMTKRKILMMKLMLKY